MHARVRGLLDVIRPGHDVDANHVHALLDRDLGNRTAESTTHAGNE